MPQLGELENPIVVIDLNNPDRVSSQAILASLLKEGYITDFTIREKESQATIALDNHSKALRAARENRARQK